MTPVEEVQVGLIVPPRMGAYRLQGTVTVVGDGRRRRVQIHDRSGRLVRSVLSDPDGTWQAEFVHNRRYLIIACDDHRDPQYNAAVADFVTPEPMEGA